MFVTLELRIFIAEISAKIRPMIHKLQLVKIENKVQ